MKTSVMVLCALAAGMLLGRWDALQGAWNPAFSEYLLYLLLFFIGLNLGHASIKFKAHFKVSAHDFLVPVLVGAGTLCGALAVSLVMQDRYQTGEVMAAGAGFGYYSLSSLIILEISGNKLAMLALLANLFREMATLVFSPILSKIFGGLAPVASGGATSMDTTLPVIVKTSGKSYVVIAVISGITLSLLVPIIIPFILSFTK